MNSFSVLKLNRFSKLIISVLIIKYIDITSLHFFPNDCEVRNESPEISRNLSATEFSNAGYIHVAVSLAGTQPSDVKTATSQGLGNQTQDDVGNSIDIVHYVCVLCEEMS